MLESWVWFAMWIALAAFFVGPAGALILAVVSAVVAGVIVALAALFERLAKRSRRSAPPR